VTTPVRHLLAGPNAAGKSTFVADVLQPNVHLEFVNADELAKERWPGEEMTHAREASTLAAAERERLIAARRSFISETVFSHVSKIDLVRRASAAGYQVTLHVILVPVEVSVRRVAFRVARGGHDVPEAKIRSRYERLWGLVADAIGYVDAVSVYDNSQAARPFRRVVRFEHGTVVGSADWPVWTPTPLRDLTSAD
jgi:predicted ABC-type ATPase